MSKTLRAIIVIQADDEFDPQDLVLRDHDVIDGFELTRDDSDDPDGGDITDTFLLTDAYIEKVEPYVATNLSARESKAVDYLQSVLLQNDEKDGLQLEIMEFLKTNYNIES